jgi:hypothetical protein
MTSYRINNLLDPSGNSDAATKSYVDTKTTDMATTSAVTTAITNALGSGSMDNNPTVVEMGTLNSTCQVVFQSTGTGTNRRKLGAENWFYYNPNVQTLYVTNLNIISSSNTKTVIKTTGWIGIGKTDPVYPLDIGISTGYTMSSAGWYAKASGSGTYYGAGDVTNISLKTIGDIWISTGSWLWITSDQRIKKNVVQLNSDKMINIFRHLRPVSFDYIDPMKTNNNKKHFGFIAQEINEILPEGISLNTDVIPNNMLKGSITKPSETDEEPISH